MEGDIMPYISIETNQSIDETAAAEFADKVSAFASEITGKPEQWIMVAFKPVTMMVYNRSHDPVAFVELKSIGLPEERCTDFSRQICDFLSTELDIPPERVYIEFKDLQRAMFGWNGKTF